MPMRANRLTTLISFISKILPIFELYFISFFAMGNPDFIQAQNQASIRMFVSSLQSSEPFIINFFYQ